MDLWHSNCTQTSPVLHLRAFPPCCYFGGVLHSRGDRATPIFAPALKLEQNGQTLSMLVQALILSSSVPLEGLSVLLGFFPAKKSSPTLYQALL